MKQVYKVSDLEGPLLAKAVARARGWKTTFIQDGEHGFYQYLENGQLGHYVDSYRPDRVSLEVAELISVYKISVGWVPSNTRTDTKETEPEFFYADGNKTYLRAYCTRLDEEQQEYDPSEGGTMPTLFSSDGPTFPVAVCRLVVNMLHGDVIDLEA